MLNCAILVMGESVPRAEGLICFFHHGNCAIVLVGECDPRGEALMIWQNCAAMFVGESDPRGEGLIMATAPPCSWVRATQEMSG